MSDFDKCPICTNFQSVFRKNFGTSVIYVKNCTSGELDTITEKNEKLSEHSLNNQFTVQTVIKGLLCEKLSFQTLVNGQLQSRVVHRHYRFFKCNS